MLKVVAAVPEEPIERQTVHQSYSKVRARLTEINVEITRLEKARWLANGGDDIDAAAETYLAGAPQAASFEPDLKKLFAERAVVERAVAIGRKRVGEANKAEQNRIANSLRPAHREAAGRVVECLIRLAEANADEARIRQQAAGGRLPFLSFPNVDLDRQDSHAKHFLAYSKRVYDITPAPRTKAE